MPDLARAYVHRERHHWSIVFPDFTIAGMGATRSEAITNGVSLLGTYLACCAEDREAPHRPIPRRWRLGFWLRRRAIWVELAGEGSMSRVADA